MKRKIIDAEKDLQPRYMLEKVQIDMKDHIKVKLFFFSFLYVILNNLVLRYFIHKVDFNKTI